MLMYPFFPSRSCEAIGEDTVSMKSLIKISHICASSRTSPGILYGNDAFHGGSHTSVQVGPEESYFVGNWRKGLPFLFECSLDLRKLNDYEKGMLFSACLIVAIISYYLWWWWWFGKNILGHYCTFMVIWLMLSLGTPISMKERSAGNDGIVTLCLQVQTRLVNMSHWVEQWTR